MTVRCSKCESKRIATIAESRRCLSCGHEWRRRFKTNLGAYAERRRDAYTLERLLNEEIPERE